MRYRFLFCLLILNLSACSMRVDVVTPAPVPTTVPTFPSSAIPPTDIPTQIPTAAVLPFITPIPVQESAGIFRIQFPPNGTYVFLEDGIPSGSSRSYAINAAQGQVMSISIHLGMDTGWTVIPMTIIGADGFVLCPRTQFEACYYWRGSLPSTQDYLVTLSPETDVPDFTMKVAINPPGVATQSFLYESVNKAAALFYNDEFAPVRFPDLYVTKFMPELSLQFIDSKSLDNTNLIEAYFLFGVSNDADSISTCIQPGTFGGEETFTGEVMVGGIPFTRSESIGAGAGNYYEQTYYRTVYQGSCYEIAFMIHSGNIGNYAPDSGIREFDRDGLMQKMEDILSTLVIK